MKYIRNKMVLKPQLQELLSKQYLKIAWESKLKKSHLLLAVVWVTPTSLFLTDGILVIQTQIRMPLKKKLQLEPGYTIKLKELEGFVCLFENCKIQITNEKNIERPKEGELSKMFKKKDFREEAKRGECNSNGLSKLQNFEKGEIVKRIDKFEMVNSTVIDLEDEENKKKEKKKVKKRISKKVNKKKSKKSILKKKKIVKNKKLSESNGNNNQKKKEINVDINFRIGFDKFSVLSPYGKYFLSGKREMIIDSLSYEKINFFKRKFKLEKHIKKFNDPKNNNLVKVLDLGDIIGEMNFQKISEKKGKLNSKDDSTTRTSTPEGDTQSFVESIKASNKLYSKKKKIKGRKRTFGRKP